MTTEGFDRLRRVLPATADTGSDGRLRIGGCDTVELARRFGTPLFVLDAADVRDRLAQFRDAFGPDGVRYASKAFLVRTFVPFVTGSGIAMECVAGGEVAVALAGGFPAARIAVHGNNKSETELAEAVAAGVGTIVVDSAPELAILERVAGEAGVAQRVQIRVAPGIEIHTHDYLKTGVEDTKFGVPLGEVLDVARTAAASPHVELVGLHCHIGSQVFDLEPFGEAAGVMVGLLADARAATGLELPELALGGGLGVAYEPSDEPPTIAAYGKVVLDAVAAAAERAGTPVPKVTVEPGRSAIASSMVTLYTVGTVKDVPGIRRYVAVDGGMSDNIRPPLYGARYTFVSADRPTLPHDRTVTIAGKLCESGDILGRDVRLPELASGDVIAVAATGAYCYAMSSNYNKLPRPAVVAVEGGDARVLARRETYDDLTRLDV